MANYVKNFVTGHGINFEVSRRNVEAFEKASSKWIEIESKLKVNSDSIIMFCGAKSNGKSSLVRYIVNSYNKINGTVANSDQSDEILDMDADVGAASPKKSENCFAYYVDYDPGQAEMTTPGIVSAHIIRAGARPLQSPTYLNVLQHELLTQASVGGTNMSVNPKMFIDNCRHVINRVKEHRKEQDSSRPIFINTMGYIRNVGLAMLTDLIKICRPTNLVVLNVEGDAMRTIYADLSPKAVDNTKASFFYETSQQSKSLRYEYDVYNLDFSFLDSTSIASRNRAALQLAYIASIPEALYKPIMQLSPKWISFKATSIYCVSSYPLKEGIVLDLLYHSWIHLVQTARQGPTQTEQTFDEPEKIENICNIIDEVGVNKLYGCGIVADVDLENKRLAIITPLNQETIDREVNCVIKPLSIQVPQEMIPAN